MSAGDPLGLSGTILHQQFRVGELSDDSRRSYLYSGTEIALDQAVALKFLKIPATFASEAFLKRFRHGTRLHYALAQTSPNIVRVLAGGTAVVPATGAKVPFSVLEWLHGRTLAADFAERRAHWGKGRSIQEAITLLDPAVEALATAHRQGVIHREVSPANLFLCDDGSQTRLKVLDFGLAKVMNDTAVEGGRARTVDMGPLASPIYAAPEQFSREAGEVGPQTDLYSLVMIFLEALRDRAVMEDSSSPLAVRVLDKHKRPTPHSLGIDVGENLELAVAEAVALRPEDRPKDIADFWDHLKKSALKDARRLAISAPPKLHARSDAENEDDETEVQIDLSFLRHSQVPTVPHPEPETLSRPMIDEEPLSESGELFAMQIPPTKRSGLPPPGPERMKTLVSPGSPPVPKFQPNVTMPTLVSAAPKPAVSIAQDAQKSSAAPFQLTKQTEEPPPTPVMPLAPPVRSQVNPPFDPRQVREASGAPVWVSAPKPPEVEPPIEKRRGMPWVQMLIAFVVVGIGLGIVAALLLK